MDRLVDLHIHSCASDGQWTGEEIIRFIKEKSIFTFAVCDHDITEMVPIISDLVENEPELNYIKGVEVTTNYEGREHHVLALNINENNDTLQELLKYNREQRLHYDKALLDFFNKRLC